jgi:HEAT repeat protein
MIKLALILLLSSFSTLLLAESSWNQSGSILFQIRKDQDKQAISNYKELVASTGSHQFELLHQMGLALLDQGFRQKNPEAQLMAIFGASIAMNDEVYYILEEGLKSPHPQIQLVALTVLAKIQNDQADRALLKALSADHPLIRLEALSLLCQKQHPQASSQAESLMIKTPKILLPLFPQLFVAIGDDHANKVLRRLLNDSSSEVRVAAILSIAEQGRDDFLPQIRQLSSHFNYSQQEVCAKALGLFNDEQSKQKLEKLALSQYPSVALAANEALVRLGNKEALEVIKKKALSGDIFAMIVLGSFEGGEETLSSLLNNPDIQIRLNATLALLKRSDSRSLKCIEDVLIYDKRDLGFSKISSPGGAFTAWKATSSTSQIFQDDPSIHAEHLHLRETVLGRVSKLPEKDFLAVADLIFSRRQQDLIPKTIALLVDLQSDRSIALLKKYQQELGAPLVRHYCNLALYKEDESGPYGDQLKEWVRGKKNSGLFQFRPVISWEKLGENYSRELTPEETSNLIIQCYETFALKQDKEGLEIILEAIQNGDSNNKYVLAGILVRAIQ